MDERKDGQPQAIAAARAGFSESTARRIGKGRVLMSQRPPRQYRTRVDPFQDVWRAEIVPILDRSPGIRATTVLEELQRLHPGRYPDRVLRSLQRHIAHWRATEGPERDLIFRQEHPPGRQALSDFTHPDSFAVTIGGKPFRHMLYHFWLAFSGWQHVRAVQGGESFTALTEGLQEALWQLGGSPREHRTDRLSAAYRNLSDREDEARGYAEFCRHYGIEPTRNNAGIAHENGSVEAAHGHLKRTIKEALELRGSNDFTDLAAYQAFLAETVARKNARRAAAVAIELKALDSLPRYRTTVHIYDDRLVCYLGVSPILTLPRSYRRAGDKAVRRIDYRHLIGALVKKPQAFRHSVFRENLFPRAAFRRAWEVLDEKLEPRKACRVYVGLLHLAAMRACEEALARHLDAVLDAGNVPDLETARVAVAPVPTALPTVTIPAPDLAAYDRLLGRAAPCKSPQ